MMRVGQTDIEDPRPKAGDEERPEKCHWVRMAFWWNGSASVISGLPWNTPSSSLMIQSY